MLAIGIVREAVALVVFLLMFAGFVAGGLLWHRPMAELSGSPPGVMVADFHSHTNTSHDVKGTLMGGFDVAANRRWHGRAGFDVFFVTDHNLATLEHPEGRPGEKGDPVACPGTEVSAWRAHIVMLGATAPIPREPYAGSLDGLERLLREAHGSWHALSVASLPEYSEHHWGDLTPWSPPAWMASRSSTHPPRRTSSPSDGVTASSPWPGPGTACSSA